MTRELLGVRVRSGRDSRALRGGQRWGKPEAAQRGSPSQVVTHVAAAVHWHACIHHLAAPWCRTCEAELAKSMCPTCKRPAEAPFTWPGSSGAPINYWPFFGLLDHGWALGVSMGRDQM